MANSTPEPELNVEAVCPCGFGRLHSDGCVFQCDWTHKICLEKIAESVRDDVGIQALIQQVSDQRVREERRDLVKTFEDSAAVSYTGQQIHQVINRRNEGSR